MRRLLLRTTAIAAIVLPVHLARAADLGSPYADFPTTFMSFEGGYFFDASPANLTFRDGAGPGDLQPGSGGGQGRFEFGQRLNEAWDYKLAISGIFLGSDRGKGEVDGLKAIGGQPGLDLSDLIGFNGETEASQKTSLQTFDIELGYRPSGLGAVETRLFAGARLLHASTEMNLETEGEAIFLNFISKDVDKAGTFNDEVMALGPRVGVDLTMPLNDSAMALVGSASGSLLFGSAESSFASGGDRLSEWDDSRTIWNVEAMAGLSFAVGERADLTVGYRVAEFGGLMSERTGMDKAGNFMNEDQSNLLLHGPFARLTVEIP